MPAFHELDACDDQAGAPLWTHADLAWINGTTHRDGDEVWAELNGNILDCDPAFADPTHTMVDYRYVIELQGNQSQGPTAICASLPIACIQTQAALTREHCQVSSIALEALDDQGNLLDRVPDKGGLSIDGCGLFEAKAPQPAPDNSTSSNPPPSGPGDSTSEEVPTPTTEAVPGLAWPLAAGLVMMAALIRRR